MHTPISAQMTDGRELIYYTDSSKTPITPRPDSRPKEDRPETNQLRKDVLTGDWISVSPHRGARAFLPPKESCPLCPSTIDYQSEIPGEFDVVVFENKNPSFGPDSQSIDPAGDAFSQEAKATGRCEVVVFSPEHSGSLAGQTEERFRTVVDAWIHRTKELSKLDGVKQVFIFENRGEEIGVTLHHPHGQIYSYPFITPTTQKLQHQIKLLGKGFFENLLNLEKTSERVLIESENFLAFVPFAARWPVEVQLLPKRHIQTLDQLTEAETEDFARIYQKLLRATDNIYQTPTPYIAAIHQAPKGDENIRLMLKITSPRRAENKLKYLAGSESAMGAFITDTSPEAIAEMLRGAMK